MTSSTDRWAVVTVECRPRPETRDAEDVDRLAELAALLADETGVGGVETQDWDTFGAPELPRLRVYTTPEAMRWVDPAARALAARLELSVRVTGQRHDGEDWAEAWKRYHTSQAYGAPGRRRLLVRPSWIPREASDPTREIVLDPGRAFGTGLHPSTRLCLQWLCRGIENPRGPVLDLGCGSGILGLAAARLFSVPVVAVDVDPEATETTRENAVRNRLDWLVCAHTGHLGAAGDREFAVVIANIRPSVLIPLAPALVRHMAPAKPGILSGIPEEDASEVLEAYQAAGVHARIWQVQDEWCAVSVRRPDP